MLNESTKKSINIIKEILIGNEISDFKNKDLKDIYKLESSVSSEIDEILDIFGLDMFEGQEGELFIVPRIENMIFGYKNEEMRSMLRVDSNLELYLCYFISYCLMTMFYKDTTGRTGRDFLSVDDLCEEVNLKFELLKSNLEDEKISVDELSNPEGCQALIDLWFNKIADTNLNSKVINEKDYKSKSKIGYCNRVLLFFENQNLLFFDKTTYKYSPKDKFKTVVVHAYTSANYVGLLNRKLQRVEEDQEGMEQGEKQD